MLLRASESGVRGHWQVFSGVRVNIDDSELVWQRQPQAHSSISHYALEAGYARLAREMDMYIASKLAELPKTLERRDTVEPMYMYVIHVGIDHSISSCGDYSRAMSISFCACSGVGYYLRAAFI